MLYLVLNVVFNKLVKQLLPYVFVLITINHLFVGMTLPKLLQYTLTPQTTTASRMSESRVLKSLWLPNLMQRKVLGFGTLAPIKFQVVLMTKNLFYRTLPFTTNFLKHPLSFHISLSVSSLPGECLYC